LLALDDSINTKVGKKIFGCEQIFDHAAKANQRFPNVSLNKNWETSVT
jgi:hypothetical protein